MIFFQNYKYVYLISLTLFFLLFEHLYQSCYTIFVLNYTYTCYWAWYFPRLSLSTNKPGKKRMLTHKHQIGKV